MSSKSGLSFSAVVLLQHYLHVAAQVIDDTNQFRQYRGEDGAFIWESTSDFVPVQPESYGNMTVQKPCV